MRISGVRSMSPMHIATRIGLLTRSANAGNEKHAAPHYIGHPIAFTAAETGTEEVELWQLGPADDALDTRGLFGRFLRRQRRSLRRFALHG